MNSADLNAILHPVNILIADKLHPMTQNHLEKSLHTLTVDPEITADTLPDCLKQSQADVLVVRSTKVNEAALTANPQLKLVIRAGAGYDTIDVSTAKERGIAVAICPRKNSIAVAELVWAHILNCDRRITDQTADFREGRWSKQKYSKARGIFGCTLGLIGFGSIAKEVAKRGKAFGVTMVTHTRHFLQSDATDYHVTHLDSLLEVAKQSDIISIHVSASSQSNHLIDATFIDAMKPNALLINTSRGSVIDETALKHGIQEKNLQVGLDVFANEPNANATEFDCHLASLNAVSVTHHIGASTEQAQQAVALEVVRIIEQFAQDNTVLNAVL